jgi:hypothetical protein
MDSSVIKRELNLYPYLAGQKNMLVDFDAASVLGFKQKAFKEILEAGIGPEIFPTRASGWFWFDKAHLAIYWHWLRKEATPADYKFISECVRRHDNFREFTHLYDEEPREMIFEALYEWRGCKTYSKVLHMPLLP